MRVLYKVGILSKPRRAQTPIQTQPPRFMLTFPRTDHLWVTRPIFPEYFYHFYGFPVYTEAPDYIIYSTLTFSLFTPSRTRLRTPLALCCILAILILKLLECAMKNTLFAKANGNSHLDIKAELRRLREIFFVIL